MLTCYESFIYFHFIFQLTINNLVSFGTYYTDMYLLLSLFVCVLFLSHFRMFSFSYLTAILVLINCTRIDFLLRFDWIRIRIIRFLNGRGKI